VRPKNYLASKEALASKFFLDLNEMVEPFRYIDGRYERANGLIRCLNKRAERPDWSKRHGETPRPMIIEPCYRIGEPQQARVTKPKEWEDCFFPGEEREEFVVRCTACKSNNVEILQLNKGGE